MYKDVEKLREYQRNYHRKRAAKGLCASCGHAARPGKRTCQACSDRNSSLAAARQRKRVKEQGRCGSCGNPTREGKWHCGACRDRLRLRRNKKKQIAVEMLGGKCFDCKKEYPPEVFDFDHCSGEKVEEIATLIRDKPWTEVLEELKKCELVCSNCHRVRTVRRGGWSI